MPQPNCIIYKNNEKKKKLYLRNAGSFEKKQKLEEKLGKSDNSWRDLQKNEFPEYCRWPILLMWQISKLQNICELLFYIARENSSFSDDITVILTNHELYDINQP